MKRILLSLFVAIIGLGAVAEDDVTGNARSMRTQIVNYIRNEGYNPSVDDDGDIMFRYEGDNYYIQCQNYGEEVYVRTFSDMSTDESPINRVRRAADFGQNEYKFVRVLVLDGFIRTECVVSINTLSEYKRRFRSYLTIIQEVEKEIKKDLPSRLHARHQMLKVLYTVKEVPTKNAGRKRNTKELDLVAKLFDEIAPKYVGRNGGYTRIIKIGQRKGDGAMQVVLELV